MKEQENSFTYIIVVIIAVFIFSGCDSDSYDARKKLVSELSSLFEENRIEFGRIHKCFFKDSLSKRFAFNYQNGKIDIDDGINSIKIDSVDQIKENLDVYQILIFMKKEKIRIISGNPHEGWITFAFEDFKYPCFNFWYRSDFNSEDEKVKRAIENIKDTKTKNWVYVLGDGWHIRGVKCF